MKDLKVTSNKIVGRVNYSVVNNELQGFFLDLSFETFAVYSKMWIYLTIRVPKHANDKNFQIEFLKTVFDVEKAIKDNQNNFFVSMIMMTLVRSAETEMKFPMQKVSEISSHQCKSSIRNFPGHLPLPQFDLQRQFHST
jgi:hypothetical protein